MIRVQILSRICNPNTDLRDEPQESDRPQDKAIAMRARGKLLGSQTPLLEEVLNQLAAHAPRELDNRELGCAPADDRLKTRKTLEREVFARAYLRLVPEDSRGYAGQLGSGSGARVDLSDSIRNGLTRGGVPS